MANTTISKNKNSVLSFRIDDTLKKQLVSLGQQINRTPAYLAEKAVGEYVVYNVWKTDMIKEALEENRKGHFISESSMTTWVHDLKKNGLKTKLAKVDILR